MNAAKGCDKDILDRWSLPIRASNNPIFRPDKACWITSSFHLVDSENLHQQAPNSPCQARLRLGCSILLLRAFAYMYYGWFPNRHLLLLLGDLIYARYHGLQRT